MELLGPPRAAARARLFLSFGSGVMGVSTAWHLATRRGWEHLGHSGRNLLAIRRARRTSKVGSGQRSQIQATSCWRNAASIAYEQFDLGSTSACGRSDTCSYAGPR